MKKLCLIIIALLALFLCFYSVANAATPGEFRAAMSRRLSLLPLQQVDPAREEISITEEQNYLAAIYAATGLKPLWISEQGPGEKAAIILEYLAEADSEGLRVNDYNVEEIRSHWQSHDADTLALLDTQLTLNFIKYTHDVRHGRIIPFEVDPTLYAEAGDSHFKPVELVKEALAAPDFVEFMRELPPEHMQYRKLRQELRFYPLSNRGQVNKFNSDL